MQSGFSRIIGKSQAVFQAIELGRRSTCSNVPVLLEGESGVGKELFARAIHEESPRHDKPFIAVNCGAIPDNLVESILFGHEKGAFTGASHKTIGKFREADGGTLFLDEIGELKPDIQVKLLRALQESEVEPVGGAGSVKVNIRIISATNRSLEQQAKDGVFREDLLYRLNVFPILIPSLKERQDDIALLINHFYIASAAIEGKEIYDISEEALLLLCAYSWPGNVRQLQNAISRAVLLCDGTILSAKHFTDVMVHMHEIEQDMAQFSSIVTSPQHALGAADASSGQYIPILRGDGTFRALEHIEEDIIRQALMHHSWHMSKVAKELGIGRSTLYRKLNIFNIIPPVS